MVADWKPPIPEKPPHFQTSEPFPISVSSLARRVYVGEHVEQKTQKDERDDKHTDRHCMSPKVIDAKEEEQPLNRYQQQKPHWINLATRFPFLNKRKK